MPPAAASCACALARARASDGGDEQDAHGEALSEVRPPCCLRTRGGTARGKSLRGRRNEPGPRQWRRHANPHPASPSPPSPPWPSSAPARPRCSPCATAWPGGRARRSGRRWATCAGCSACRRPRCWGWACCCSRRRCCSASSSCWAPATCSTSACASSPAAASRWCRADGDAPLAPPPRARLFGEALLTASTNPKPILFFTALFPQFLDAHAPLLPQFLVLTGLFMALSFTSLVTYALLASRARALLARPRFSLWLDRSVGAIFVALRRGACSRCAGRRPDARRGAILESSSQPACTRRQRDNLPPRQEPRQRRCQHPSPRRRWVAATCARARASSSRTCAAPRSA